MKTTEKPIDKIDLLLLMMLEMKYFRSDDHRERVIDVDDFVLIDSIFFRYSGILHRRHRRHLHLERRYRRSLNLPTYNRHLFYVSIEANVQRVH